MARQRRQNADLARDLLGIPLRQNPNRLRYAVALTGITQSHIGQTTGITSSRLSQLGKGYGPPVRQDEADRIAQFFGVPVNALFPAGRVPSEQVA